MLFFSEKIPQFLEKTLEPNHLTYMGPLTKCRRPRLLKLEKGYLSRKISLQMSYHSIC